jgi:hypothetical protein
MNVQSVLSIHDPSSSALAPVKIRILWCLDCGAVDGEGTKVVPVRLVDEQGDLLVRGLCCTSCGFAWDEPAGALR